MSEASYKVKIWRIETRKHRSGNTTYRVRWTVEGKLFPEPFPTWKLADSFRSDLVSAARKGEAFSIESGLPQSMERREVSAMSTFALAVKYAMRKWPDAAPKYRRSIASSLVTITLATLHDDADFPAEPPVVRRALTQAFNVRQLEAGLADDVAKLVQAVEQSSCSAAHLAKPDHLRSVLNAFDRNLDGSHAAPDSIRIRRVALRDFLDFGVEKKVFETNPMDEVKIKKRSYEVTAVEPSVVVNPIQGRMLIAAVRERRPDLAAFFGLMFYAALRPEEAVSLRAEQLAIPTEGRGWLRLSGARPEIGSEWTNSGTASEERSLKHRSEGSTRPVPVASELTELLHAHLVIFGTAPDGRLFRGTRNNGRLSSTVYGRTWEAARRDVFTPAVQASPLGKRPYDLRHAAVSIWLASGVLPAQVAEWAGHSLAVLMRVYAKVLSGGADAAADKLDRGYGA